MTSPGLYWTIHPESRGFAPSREDRQRLADLAPADAVSVTLWPRRLAHEVVGRSGEDYRFRAVSRGPSVVVLTDGTETPASIRWLLAHELGHQQVRQRGLRDWLTLGAPVDGGAPASDRYHLLDPEERWADGLATRTFGERLDRAWWRARTPVVGEVADAFGALSYFRGC